jgi:hypothetical protein
MPTARYKTSWLSLNPRAFLAFFASTLAVGAIAAPAATALPATYKGISSDGGKVFFSTEEQVLPEDTDSRRDIYVRSYDSGLGEYRTKLVSTGPNGGNGPFNADFEKASSDGTKVFFSTREKLVGGDTDAEEDVYVRNLETETTELVSVAAEACGSSCGNGPAEATFSGAVADGNIVFFVSTERLAPGDTDSAKDIYARNLETHTTTWVSAGAAACSPTCGNEGALASLRGASPDGSKAFFTTVESLTPDDTDNDIDVYARELSNGATTRISQGSSECAPSCGNGSSLPAVFAAVSSDGSKVFFETSESLVAADTDNGNDVYMRSGGVTTLVTEGTEAEKPANLKAISSTGGQVLFITAESLVGADTNGADDVYKWSGGSATLVTSGTCTQGTDCGSTFDWATPDTALLFFTTTESLSGSDTDTSADIYRVSTSGGATPVLVSAGGNGAFSAIFNGSSSDGSKAYFSTSEPLLPQDEDTARDIYLRDLNTSTTVLTTPAGVCPTSECSPGFTGTSNDGQHAFFVTNERLASKDVDSEADVYERDHSIMPAETRLVSTDNSDGVPPATPVLTGTSPASPGSSTTPAILGHADPESTIRIYTTADCSGIPVTTGTAAELEGAGIVVSVPASSTTSFRATATDNQNDTSACSASIGYTQEGTAGVPPTPVLTGTSPASPGTSTTPAILGHAQAGATVQLYTSSDCSGGPIATGSTAQLESTGITVSVAPGSTTSFRATATNTNGASTCSAAITYKQEDQLPPPPPGEEGGGGGGGDRPKFHDGGIAFVTPVTRITFGPSFKTRKRRVTFRFVDSTGQPGTKFSCRIDRRRSWKSCTSPALLKKLKRGKHVFRVKGMNAAGVWEEKPVKRAFKVVKRTRKVRR